MIVFIIVLLVLSCGLAVRYNQDANSTRDDLNTERYQRMTVEEDLQKASTQIDALKAELLRTQDRLAQIETVLEKTKAINEDLKSRLDQANEIKQRLDQRIGELQAIGL